MPLEIEKLDVRQATIGSRTCFSGASLQVCREHLRTELTRRDQRIAGLQVEVANPGDATRIVCVKDVVEPRVRLSGKQPGEGAIRVLAGAAVVTCGPIVGYQEGIIDMSGPGAALTPFSRKHLVVLKIDVAGGITTHEHESALRYAGLRAAEYLAQAAAGEPPDAIETVSWSESPVDQRLPRIAYVYMVLSQGLLHDTYVLGRDAKQGLPLLVDPRLGMAGGLVSGNCVSACDKNATYFHQNNPVIAHLLKGHGVRWNLVGVVITNEPTRLDGKQRSAQATIELVKELRADGAVITKEGFGNPDADQMMIVRGLEQSGVRTVTMTDEYAGRDGDSQSLADATPEADAVVSTGNANQPIELPPMQKVVGDLPDVARLAGGYAHTVRQDGSLEVELQAIIGSTNQLGYGCLRCCEY